MVEQNAKTTNQNLVFCPIKHKMLYCALHCTHAQLVQALRNLVNLSGQRIQHLFNDLDRRLKSADKKDQSGIRDQSGDGVRKKHKTGHRGPPDNQTTSTAITIVLALFHRLYI